MPISKIVLNSCVKNTNLKITDPNGQQKDSANATTEANNPNNSSIDILDTLSTEDAKIIEIVNETKSKLNKGLYKKGKNLTVEEIFDNNVDGYELKTMNYDGKNYIACIPKGLNKNEEVPLVVHFHGQMKNGDKTKDLRTSGIGQALKELGNSEYKKFNGIFLIPQTDGSWATDRNVEYMDGLIEEFVNNSGYNINTDKIALSGHSMGTRGIINYYQKSKYQSMFSAIALESVTFPEDVEKLKDIQIPTTIYTGHSDGQNCKESANKAEEMIKNGELENVTSVWIDATHNNIQHEIICGQEKDEVDSNNNNIPDFFENMWS